MTPPRPVAQAPVPDPRATKVVIKGASHLQSSDSYVNEYNLKGFGMLPGIVQANPQLREFVGNFIYHYIVPLVGDDLAP